MPKLRPRKRDTAPPPNSRKRRQPSTTTGREQERRRSKRIRTSAAAMSASSSSAPAMRYQAAHSVFAITELIEKIFLECNQETLLTTACRVSKHWHSVIQTSTPIQQALFFLPIHETPNCPVEPMKNPILAKHFAYFFSTRRTSQCRHVHGFPEIDFFPMFDVQFPHVRTELIDPEAQDMTGTSEHPVELDRLYPSEGEDGNGGSNIKGASEAGGSKDDESDSYSENMSAGSRSDSNSSSPPSRTTPRRNDPQPPKWRTVTEWPARDTAKLERYLRDGASWRRMLVRQPPIKRLAYAERTLVDVNYVVHPHYDYYKGLLESPTTAKSADNASLPMSITTPTHVATGGLRMDRLYDTVHLNLSRTTIKDQADSPRETYLESRFHVYWNGVPRTMDCPDDRMRNQIRRAVGKAGKETLVVQILAVERPLNHRVPSPPEVVRSFYSRFKSEESGSDRHYVHKKGTHAITGPNWLKKKWVSDRVDDAGFILHWADMSDELDGFDELDDFDSFIFQDLLEHHMMGLHDYLDMDDDFGWDVWDEHYLDD